MSSELSAAFRGFDIRQMLNGARERVSSTEKGSRRIDKRRLLPQIEFAARLNTGRGDRGIGLSDTRTEGRVCRLPAAAPSPHGGGEGDGQSEEGGGDSAEIYQVHGTDAVGRDKDNWAMADTASK